MSRALWTSLALASIAISSVGCSAEVDTESESESSEASLEGCEPYNGYTAALADATIRCLGTIDPYGYATDRYGRLQRRFAECPNAEDPKSTLADIDSLLSLQRRERQLPGITACIAKPYVAWRNTFIKQGNTECPVYKPLEILQDPEKEVDSYIKELPELPSKDDIRVRPGKTFTKFAVGWRYGKPLREQPCRDPLECAQRCTAGFAGYDAGIIKDEQTGEPYFLGDPVWWELSTVYSGYNPFMSPGYYHAMSYYSPTAIYGHRNRAGERCSMYAGGIHWKVALELDCLNYADPATCVSVCREPAVPTTPAY